MRHFLISALLLTLVAGCSSVNVGPHRIDVQQGNALDQENVSRLKLGLSRSQVRFLLGTPLVVDPFRTDRWDYVYVYYKAGKLTEQKHITLFFEGDTLARIEGDLPEPAVQPPAPAPVVKPESKNETAVLPIAAEAKTTPEPQAPSVKATASQPEPVAKVAPVPVAAAPAGPTAAASDSPSGQASIAASSVVSPLPSPENAPAYVDRRPSAQLSLQPETDVAKIQPAPFPAVDSAPSSRDAPVLKSVNEWAAAWARHDEEAYLAAYAPDFVPQGGGNRSDWEKRRRLLLGMVNNTEIRIDAPVVDRIEQGAVTVTFNQFYRAENYRDAVVKQLRMAEHDGRWLIVEEKVLSTLRGAQP